MRGVAWAVLVVLALLGEPAFAQANTTISAGVHVAGVRIGGVASEAIAAFGSLYNQADSRSGKYTLYEWPLRPFVVITEKESGRIVLCVIVLSDLYRTDKGNITGGSERAAVEAAYGREFTTEEDESSTTLVYDGQGIAFDIGKRGAMSGRVVQIVVFVPGQWKAITQGL
ncbi:MAG: hypothetical protein QN141_01975 [Armatimonadota bacterium]|nr:hypothetical protein [Armatimonadota bacterium]MDR7450669.1 hypothetical protein [Armatimonadota bacterium]MDR7466025.1 hypothetical protein [Armatimonadota bacterium]MDR7493938.1 hypothetical protein [Armatimonadota bacterium]MDR7504043.1 hypothetical protein [Armatimonadota bacterium]